MLILCFCQVLEEQHIESEVPCDLPIAHVVPEMSCLRDGRDGADHFKNMLLLYVPCFW